MAQAKLRNLTTVISRWYGGMSNDDYVGQADSGGNPMSFYDGENVNIRKQNKFITVNNGYSTPADFGTFGTVGNISCLFSNTTTSKAYGTSAGKIYDYSGTVAQAGLTSVYNMFQSANNFYSYAICSGGNIARWTVDNTASTGAAGGTFNAALYTIGGWINPTSGVPILTFNGFVYIASLYQIFRYDITNNTSDLFLQIDNSFSITGLTLIGDRIYVYANDGTSGIQYLWNGVKIISGQSTAGQLSQIRWADKPILNVANLNNVDYVVVGDRNKRAFYRVNGYSPDLILQSKFETDTYSGKFFFKPDYVNAIETINNTIYLPGDGCIYTWGHNISGMPDSTIREITLPTSATNGVTLMQYVPAENKLYFSYRDTNNHTNVSTISLSETGAFNQEAGTIIFNPVLGDLYSSENNALKIRVGYDLPPKVGGFDKGRINVYVKSGYSGGYKSFYIKSGWVSAPAIGATYSTGGITYTVYNVTYVTSNLNDMIIHTTCPDTYTDLKDINKINDAGTLSKVSGGGPASFTFFRTLNGMQLIGIISDETDHKQLFDVSDANFQMTFALDVISYDPDYTPRLWDFVYAYTDIENDI